MKTDEEIEKTLTSLDHLARVPAPKELKAELLQKIRFLRNKFDPWYLAVKYGIAAMITLAALNGYILLKSDWFNTRNEVQLEVLANEWYDGSDLIEYNYENE